MAWRAQRKSTFMSRATRKFERKRHLICFLLVHLVGTQACRFALRAHDVNWMEKGGQLGGAVMELNTLKSHLVTSGAIPVLRIVPKV